MNSVASMPVSGARVGVSGAVKAEWTKLWSLRSTWWSIVGSIAIAVVLVPLSGFTFVNNAEQLDAESATVTVSEVAVLGTNVVQLVLAVIGILAMTTEYSSGTLLSSLQAVPSRGRFLWAKAAVVGVATLAVGLILGALVVMLAVLSLGDRGVDPDGGPVPMVFAIGLQLSLTALFSLGVATLIRSTAGALTIVVLLLIVIPAGIDIMSLDWLTAVLPARASAQLIAGGAGSLSSLMGALVLLGWAFVAGGAGFLSLQRRDVQ